MRSIDDIKKQFPKTKFFFPSDDCGIFRARLSSTKHKYLIRVVFSYAPEADVVSAQYRQVFVTQAEMEELKQIFFKPNEWDDCVIVDHPTNKYAKFLCRIRRE